MSANNWAICPKCKKERVEWKSEIDKNSFREDYEIGLSEDGYFSVSYGGRCDRCGFSFQYNYEKKAAIENERR